MIIPDSITVHSFVFTLFTLFVFMLSSWLAASDSAGRLGFVLWSKSDI